MPDKSCHQCQHARGEGCALFADPKLGPMRAHAVRRVGGHCGPQGYYWKERTSQQPQQPSKPAPGWPGARQVVQPPASRLATRQAPALDRKRLAAGERDE